MQIFLNEIEDLVNEEQVDYNFAEKEEFMNNTCRKLIEKKEKTKGNSFSIQQKINLFLGEVNFINHVFDEYSNENERKKKIADSYKQQQSENSVKVEEEELFTKEQNEILKDLIFLELGLNESSPNANDAKKFLLNICENLEKIENKEFILTTKKALDIRIDDFRKNEISENYFSKAIHEIYVDTVNQLVHEVEKKENMLKQDTMEDSVNIAMEEIPKTDLILEPSVEGMEMANQVVKQCETYNNPTPLPEKDKTGGEVVVFGGNVAHRKNKKDQQVVHSNYFHKKKMKLVQRWQKVAQESKLMNDSDASV
ncbi:hypothetical protein, conserved [Plasmodium gonderi]|uniref:Uncharacterized protein n=1 Tax=Plasmodium gonderi TaxID=77519 RepID=A0A1Y1JL49_PLAGO|nr:hypothetical protein, conserved [Plasmodium gonderi]GAW82980.1 hypothetical protein, conserved [Plasmodium gonderi]